MNPRIAIMMRQGAAILLALLAGSTACAASDDLTAVTAVQVRVADEATTQVVVALAASRRARLFTLTAPDRVVLDIPAADVAETVVRQTLALEPPGDALRRIRVGRQAGQVLRLVFDTRRAVSARLTTLEREPDGGVQLVVTLDTAAGHAEAPRPVATTPPPPVLPPAAPPRVVAIDAGHGGADLGSLGRGGTREKDVTLALAQALAGRINATAGWRAVLTRADDSSVSLAERARRAAQSGASLFVSLQASAEANPDLAGAAVYVYDRVASSRNAAWLAEREATDTEAAPGSMADIAPAAGAHTSSLAIAEAVVRALQPNVPLQHAVVQRAPLASLRYAAVPAVLVNVACLSNREDERRARSADYAAQVADAISRALGNDVARDRPPGAAASGAVVAANP